MYIIFSIANNESMEKKISKLGMTFLAFIPIIFLLGVLDKYIYFWSGNDFAAFFAPKDESVWEYLKIVFYPSLFVWIIGYFIFKKLFSLSGTRWTIAAVISTVFAMISFVAMYYILYAGFGVDHTLWLTLIVYFIAVCEGIALGYWIYCKQRDCLWSAIICLVIALTMVAAFISINYLPSDLPMFIPPTANL